MPAPKILVIEDELPIRKFLRVSLESNGYRMLESGRAEQGLQMAASDSPDVVILDLGLPDLDGLTVIERLREWSSVPIIVLSARGREADKVLALDSGADDYLTKPFSIGELLARLRVTLRHQAGNFAAAEPVTQIGDLIVDQGARRVFLGATEVHLTPIEYKLLTTLVRHSGKVVTHRQLLKEVWGPDSLEENQYLRVYFGQLRRKIETDPARPRYLITEAGVGYRIADQ
jgi:two-component system KDP operon response regulator KdpE